MKDLESLIQVACVTWFTYQYQDWALLLHHSPNGGYRNAKEAAKFKRMGVRAGFPDLILLLPNGTYNYLAVEMKTNESGSRQTERQLLYQRIMESHGGKYVVCRSEQEFETIVNDYLEPIL
jgi:hypothetical protein